jgi:hypothetical protein
MMPKGLRGTRFRARMQPGARNGSRRQILALAFTTPAVAQVAPARHEGAITLAQAPSAAEKTTKSSRSRKKEAASKREPTVNQMAARERQRKCAAEWKEAKAAGKTNGLKWPKYWSQCNARLKGNSA